MGHLGFGLRVTTFLRFLKARCLIKEEWSLSTEFPGGRMGGLVA